jgi:DNA-binding transcriptional regulator YiaG
MDSVMTAAEARCFRKQIGLTQEQMGLVMGVSARTIGRWEDKGNIPLTAAHLMKLVCSMEWRKRAEEKASEQSDQ